MKNIHVLPTEKPSRLYFYKGDDKYPTQYGLRSLKSLPFKDSFTNQNIYITSDEEIKDDDWYVNLQNKNRNYINRSGTTKFDGLYENCKKIILTTDQDLIGDGVQAIDDDFLEWFVKNPSCEEVEVYRPIEKGIPLLGYKIIIPKEEDKYPNNLQGSVIDLSAENNSFYLPEQKRVMFKFDDDEPEHINSIVEGGKFIIELQEGIISFEKDGKKFQIYIETT
jgi:hypothetical protein